VFFDTDVDARDVCARSEEATEIAMSAVRKKRFYQANKYNTVTVEDVV